MPTTTPASRRAPSPRAFTLFEVLASTALSGIIMVAVLSSAVVIARSGYLLNNYSDMEQQARTALETFAVDARMTEVVAWGRADDDAPLTSLRLQAVDGTAVTYAYDAAGGALNRTDNAGTTTVITGIQSFTFSAYKYDDAAGLDLLVPGDSTLTQLDNETKMVQLSLSASRAQTSVVTATNNVVSARFVLRNKRRGT
ncbi:MAG: prepilin-type N-terminal cleavage/methylation domain-containing protein [Verrucomicrobiota bacterium]